MAALAMETRIIKALRAQKKKPLTPKELQKKAGLRHEERHRFQEALAVLQQEGRVFERKGKLLLAEDLGLVSAAVVKVTGTFGFARPEEGDRDVFIPGRMLRGAMPGDTVLLKVTRGSGELPEGEVYQVTREGDGRFAAVLEVDEFGARVVPDHFVRFPLQVNPRGLMGARDGDKVLCEISLRGERHSDHIARVVAVFGSADGAAACCEAVLAANGIHREFSPEALEQARAVVAGSGIHPAEIAARLDLREGLIFTIDGADSKDLDDAVSLTRRPDGWDLGVHIADVSYYVTHGTPLDREAFDRGTSVYFADSVIPMLPEELSNGICSLNPGEDRLAFSALMTLDAEGKILRKRFVKTVIRSRVKGVYTEINRLLDGDAPSALLEKYRDLLPAIREMRQLAEILTANRYARGGVNLETQESKIILDGSGRAVGVAPRERGLSERIIEEFMLTANEAAAGYAGEQRLPFVYRVHENPPADKAEALFDVLDRLGIPARRRGDGVTGRQLGRILDRVRGTPLEAIVNTMVLRTMAKARYSEVETGHFGLALEDYAHFTSPIRRYADLVVHRILSAQVAGVNPDKIRGRFGKFAAESALRASDREVAATAAERACEDSYKAEYMRTLLGDELEGKVASVTSFGIYVALPNTVEGLVHLTRFPGASGNSQNSQWQSDGALAVVERHTGRRVSLGDPVRVRVDAADVSAGTVDFSLIL